MAEAKRPPNLIGCRAKIDWAQRHFNTLERYIADFFARHKYTISVEPGGEGHRYLARLIDAPTIPAIEWALLIGDCVHNLRSALDYIAWELAGADPADGKTMFPIYLTRDGYRANFKKRIRRLPREAQTLIEQLQPYNTPDPPRSTAWTLQALDVADKHKLLTVVAAIPESGNIIWVLPGAAAVPKFTVSALSDIPLEPNAVLAEIVVPPATPKMDMKAEVTPAVAFGESLGWGRRTSVLIVLRQLIDDAERVRREFKGRFNMSDE